MSDNSMFQTMGGGNSKLAQYEEPRTIAKCPGIILDATEASRYKFSRVPGDMTELPVTKYQQGAPEGSKNPYGVSLAGKIYQGEDFQVVGVSQLPDPTVPSAAPVEEVEIKGTKKQKKLAAEIKAVVAAATVQEQAPLLKIKLSGNFGAYTGSYSDYIVSNDCLILMYPLSLNVFEPPQDDSNSLRVTVNNNTFTVFYLGIAFEVPSLGYGFQVFLTQEEQ